MRKKKEEEKKQRSFFVAMNDRESTCHETSVLFSSLSLFIAAKKQVIFGIRRHRKCFVRIFQCANAPNEIF